MRICKMAPAIFLVICIVAAGCADLKGVNKFSVSGARLAAQPFPYGYGAYCFDSCYIYDTARTVNHYPCDDGLAKRYDTAVAREAGKLSAYFAALARLSGSAEVINVDALAAPVVAGTYGKLTISSTEATAAINANLKTIKTIDKWLGFAGSVIGLGASIATGNVGGIVSAVEGIMGTFDVKVPGLS
jgi:hypothetical protein